MLNTFRIFKNDESGNASIEMQIVGAAVVGFALFVGVAVATGAVDLNTKTDNTIKNDAEDELCSVFVATC